MVFEDFIEVGIVLLMILGKYMWVELVLNDFLTPSEFGHLSLHSVLRNSYTPLVILVVSFL